MAVGRSSCAWVLFLAIAVDWVSLSDCRSQQYATRITSEDGLNGLKMDRRPVDPQMADWEADIQKDEQQYKKLTEKYEELEQMVGRTGHKSSRELLNRMAANLTDIMELLNRRRHLIGRAKMLKEFGEFLDTLHAAILGTIFKRDDILDIESQGSDLSEVEVIQHRYDRAIEAYSEMKDKWMEKFAKDRPDIQLASVVDLATLQDFSKEGVEIYQVLSSPETTTPTDFLELEGQEKFKQFRLPKHTNTERTQTNSALTLTAFLTGEVFTIHLLPGVPFSNNWPETIRRWGPASDVRPNPWLTSMKMREIMEDYVVFPGPRRGIKDPRLWAVCFYCSERQLCQLADENSTTVHHEARLLLEYLCVEDEKVFLPMNPRLLRMVFLQQCMQFPHEMDWSPKRLGRAFVDLFLAVIAATKSGSCPHFFIPHLNMLGHLGRSDLKQVSRHLRAVLNDIVENPTKTKFLPRRTRKLGKNRTSHLFEGRHPTVAGVE